MPRNAPGTECYVLVYTKLADTKPQKRKALFQRTKEKKLEQEVEPRKCTLPIFRKCTLLKTFLRVTKENKGSHSMYTCKLALRASGYNGNLHTCGMHALFGCINKS